MKEAREARECRECRERRERWKLTWRRPRKVARANMVLKLIGSIVLLVCGNNTKMWLGASNDCANEGRARRG